MIGELIGLVSPNNSLQKGDEIAQNGLEVGVIGSHRFGQNR